jgi:hypothetical protein
MREDKAAKGLSESLIRHRFGEENTDKSLYISGRRNPLFTQLPVPALLRPVP